MRKVITDVEIYRNCFLCSIKDYDTKEITTWEISERRNDYKLIKDWFDNYKEFLLTFNGIHYDVPMLLFLIQNTFKNWQDCTNQLKDWSDKLIREDRWWADWNLKKYKYHNKWYDCDLFLYWSKMLRMSKKISLKGLAVQLNYPVIQELPFTPDSILDSDQIDALIKYNSIHDLSILEWMLDKPCRWQGKLTTMYEQVVMRCDAFNKYKFNKSVFSWDGVKLGLNILMRSYAQKTNQDEQELFQRRGEFKPIPLKDIIEDRICFTPTELQYSYKVEDKVKVTICNSFYALLEHLKATTVHSTTDLNYRVVYHGICYDIKSGGLHSWHKNEIVEPDLDKYIYRDGDVSGYYPTLGAMYKFTPPHLPNMDIFLNDFRLERLANKKAGKKAEERLQKLALNGGYYGNLNSEYSPMYYPKGLLSTTINGQLLLLMWCEWLQEAGIQVDMVNTDGVTVLLRKDKEQEYKDICSKWEQMSMMELEFVDFKKVIRANINNYLAIGIDNSVKEKGFFVTEPDFGNKVDFLVVAKALQAFFISNIQPRDFIQNHSNIFDFCGAAKVDRSYTVEWMEQKQQRLNRYYVSKKGGYLYKCRWVEKTHPKTKEKYNVYTKTHMLSEGSVQLYNNHIGKPMKEYQIDYDFYIAKTMDTINELQQLNQLKLF